MQQTSRVVPERILVLGKIHGGTDTAVMAKVTFSLADADPQNERAVCRVSLLRKNGEAETRYGACVTSHHAPFLTAAEEALRKIAIDAEIFVHDQDSLLHSLANAIGSEWEENRDCLVLTGEDVGILESLESQLSEEQSDEIPFMDSLEEQPEADKGLQTESVQKAAHSAGFLVEDLRELAKTGEPLMKELAVDMLETALKLSSWLHRVATLCEEEELHRSARQEASGEHSFP